VMVVEWVCDKLSDAFLELSLWFDGRSRRPIPPPPALRESVLDRVEAERSAPPRRYPSVLQASPLILGTGTKRVQVRGLTNACDRHVAILLTLALKRQDDGDHAGARGAIELAMDTAMLAPRANA
jgi:hypothetical protein